MQLPVDPTLAIETARLTSLIVNTNITYPGYRICLLAFGALALTVIALRFAPGSFINRH